MDRYITCKIDNIVKRILGVAALAGMSTTWQVLM